MPTFAIHYTYPDDTTELMRVRPEHWEWLSALPGLRVAGMYKDARDEALGQGPTPDEPTTEEPANAALIVVEAGSIEDVTATCDDDPYWRAGLIRRRVIRQWDPPLGPWVADPTQSLA